ncbi:hypothetical protein ACFQZ4_53135 [Catellatospora coxensis]
MDAAAARRALPGRRRVRRGKGSFVQSFMRSVAGGIAAGTVRVVGFDPKGGMEMAGVAPLLARFLCDGAAEMADALEEEVTVLNERTACAARPNPPARRHGRGAQAHHPDRRAGDPDRLRRQEDHRPRRRARADPH